MTSWDVSDLVLLDAIESLQNDQLETIVAKNVPFMERLIIKGSRKLKKLIIQAENLVQLLIHNVDGDVTLEDYDCPHLKYLEIDDLVKVTEEQVINSYFLKFIF